MINREAKMIKRGAYRLGIVMLAVLGCASQTREERELEELTVLEREYDALTASKTKGDLLQTLQEEDLLQAVLEFERKNQDHFRSKVDLGVYYVSNGDVKQGKEYLLKAKALIKNTPKTSIGEEYIAEVYGGLAVIAIEENNLATAMEYANLAEAFDNEAGWFYKRIKPRIMILQDKKEEALKLYDKLYQEQQETMQDDDIINYMILLGLAKRYKESAGMADLYFEKGPYVSGLGSDASKIYRAVGQFKKSVYAGFLEFEFQASYYPSYQYSAEKEKFFKYLDSFEQQMARWRVLDETREAIQLIRSAFDPSVEYRQPEKISFFAEEYIIIKNKIRDAAVNRVDYNKFLQLEHYFSVFPSYYWNIWLAAGILDKPGEKNFIPALERIIALGNNNIYIQQARDELARISEL
jgi:hypothetical protein